MAVWAAIIFYTAINIFPNDTAYYRCVRSYLEAPRPYLRGPGLFVYIEAT